jgi:hypothetical protein
MSKYRFRFTLSVLVLMSTVGGCSRPETTGPRSEEAVTIVERSSHEATVSIEPANLVGSWVRPGPEDRGIPTIVTLYFASDSNGSAYIDGDTTGEPNAGQPYSFEFSVSGDVVTLDFESLPDEEFTITELRRNAMHTSQDRVATYAATAAWGREP